MRTRAHGDVQQHAAIRLAHETHHPRSRRPRIDASDAQCLQRPRRRNDTRPSSPSGCVTMVSTRTGRHELVGPSRMTMYHASGHCAVPSTRSARRCESWHVQSRKPGAREGDRQLDGSLASTSRASGLAAPGGSGRCCRCHRRSTFHRFLTSDRRCRLEFHPWPGRVRARSRGCIRCSGAIRTVGRRGSFRRRRADRDLEWPSGALRAPPRDPVRRA